METQLQTTQQHSLVPADVMPIDLQTALAGDLSRLTPEARLKFYGAVCETTGLNPLTKPFDWMTFQGKQVLYANKGCAEQLRKIHGVTVEIVERKVEFGCLIVRVKATSKDGRSDEAIGAVAFNPNASGDAAAVAMMKCETKAKRRVTLSICGLGLLDESELDTVREKPSAKVTAAFNGEDSAAARAEKLNQSLTAGDKKDAIDAEAVTESFSRRETPTYSTPVMEPGSASAGQRGASAAPLNSEHESPLCQSGDAGSNTSAPDRKVQPELDQSPQATQPSAQAKLSGEEVAQLEAAMMACPQPARAHQYLIYRNWLKLNQPLNELPRKEFTQITTKTPVFVRMVENWKGSL